MRPGTYSFRAYSKLTLRTLVVHYAGQLYITQIIADCGSPGSPGVLVIPNFGLFLVLALNASIFRNVVPDFRSLKKSEICAYLLKQLFWVMEISRNPLYFLKWWSHGKIARNQSFLSASESLIHNCTPPSPPIHPHPHPPPLYTPSPHPIPFLLLREWFSFPTLLPDHWKKKSVVGQ